MNRNVIAAVRGMSKRQGQVCGGWTLFAGSLTTIPTVLFTLPAILHTILVAAGVTAMIAAVALIVWSFIGTPDAGPAARALTPSRAAGHEPRRATRRSHPRIARTAAEPRRAAL